jgi:hypothetical protein
VLQAMKVLDYSPNTSACRLDHYDIMIYPCRYTDPTLPDQISTLFTILRVLVIGELPL